MSGEAGGGELRGIGARLRAAREKRGLTLLQAAERLHLDARVVQALEAEDFAALGADVYVRGHLRRYAEAVGESPVQLQELYSASSRGLRPDLTRIARREPEQRGSRLLLPALLVVVGFAVAGALWWLLTLPGEKAHPLPAERAPAADAARAAEVAAPSGEVAVPGADTGTAPTPAQRALPPTSLRAPVSTGGTEARLDLVFSAPSWVEVSDVAGRHLLHGLIEAGSTRTLTGTAPLLVVLGNAPAVTLRFNGEPVTAGPLVRRDGSAHLLIDAAGRLSAPAPRLAHGD
jgi:cytoskeleton protein RodZ